MFWVLAAFACLVVDRDQARERLVDWYETSPLSPQGPSLGARPWRIAAGVCLGAAMGVKWSGIFFLIAFAVMSLMWDLGARRAVGLREPYRATWARDVPSWLAAVAAVPAIAYVLTWTGWFATANGWGRNWDQATSSGPGFFMIDSMRSWLQYHFEVLGFHSGLDDYHANMSEPWTWPVLFRPVSFHYPAELPPSACGADRCSQAVLAVGTPALWYGAVLALLGLVVWYVARRDWRAGAVLLTYAAGWLPWIYYATAQNRTMYLFYMIPLVPFMVLALTLVAGLALGKADAAPARRAAGAAAVGAFALIVLINFWWLYPVLSAETIPYQEWWARMLMDSWVAPAPK
jgi:dolichyl-phosphate-mannose--protein O-mannosyl transferase